MQSLPLRFGAAASIVLFVSSFATGQENDTALLAQGLRPFLACLSGERDAFQLAGRVEVPIDGKPQRIDVRLQRFDANSFDLSLKHDEYWVELRRRADVTAFALPYHKVVYVGRGETDPQDQLAPQGIAKRLISSGSTVSAIAPVVLQSNPASVALLLTGLLNATYDAETKRWAAGNHVTFQFLEDSGAVDIQVDQVEMQLEVRDPEPAVLAADQWSADLRVVELDRAELEQQLARGVRRALEILAPSPRLTSPVETARRVPHGELRWIGGQRVALLTGTPDEIGRAHGELLKAEAEHCIDSVLYAFGTVQTIRTGRWFRQDLESAYQRLAPYIPEDHKRETRALAEALAVDPQLAETLNVFPELFHCSGFAVFGRATADGKLYHGRVLDYMTAIGLQDAATTFIVAVDGKIPFANVGYAGFTGSVSGMNARAISLGEMGGRGEGQWDGTPMATLMRRALEECATLDEVIDLWKNNPRTCEYYYVFADGKTNRAVGVSAVPESVEFVEPGQSHPRLGEGIQDAVVLSAGSRLEKLRERVQEKHGAIDAETGMWLMSRPVAMQSNLHNVLFVPADGILYVANADHAHPAAERPYVRLDLNELLGSLRSGQ